MKKYYHVTLNLFDEPDKTFYPYVPDNRIEAEDSETPRICVCDSIEGCLSAVPFGGSGLENILTERGASCPIKVYVFYEEDIKEGNLVTPEELYRSDKVRDAFYTREHWIINQVIKPKECFVISVTHYSEYDIDDVPYSFRIAYEKDESIDWEAGIEGHFTIIEDVQYEYVEQYASASVLKLDSDKPLNQDDIDYITSVFEDESYILSYIYDFWIEPVSSNPNDKTYILNIESCLNLSLSYISNKLNRVGYNLKFEVLN